MELNVETCRRRLVGALTTITLIATPFTALPSAFATEDQNSVPVAVSSTAPEASTLPNVSVQITPTENRTYNVGETIRFNVTITNHTPNSYGIQIEATETNLDNTLKCRWSQFRGNGHSANCNRSDLQLTHKVTQDDAKAGQFIPHYTVTLYEPKPNSREGYKESSS